MADYNPDVSIIIPTFNRIELLEFTLLSLYEQSLPANSFEVIVVDDCSSDQTITVLEKLQPPYRLTVLHNKFNHGAAYCRNRGINLARGRIILFLDEMLVDRNFIKDHVHYHEKENMVVTTHFNGQRIYSHYYPNFTRNQRLKYKRTSRKLSSLHHRTIKKDVLRLFSRDEVINHNVLRYGYKVKTISKWYNNLQNTYGKYLEGMTTPWFLCITNGLSVSKKLLYKAGLFDEKLKTWMEDWELGFRLYLAGATFYNATNIACYHQTHPIGRRIKDKMINCLYFSKKHPLTEVLLIPAMSAIFYWSVEKLGKIITQYKELEKDNFKYSELITAFRDLAETLQWHVDRMIKGQSFTLLSSFELGFTRWDPTFADKVNRQLIQLQEDSLYANNYHELIKGFKDLLLLPIMKT